MYKNNNYNYKIDNDIERVSIVSHDEKFKRIVVENRENKPYYNIDCFLDGYKESDAKDFIELLSKKESLELIHEYRNIYDPNRVTVYSKDPVKLGYLPKIVSSFLINKLKLGKKVKGYIKNVNSGVDIADELRIEIRLFVEK